MGPMSGRRHSLATREKLRLSHLGWRHSEETKRKIGLGQKNRPPISESTRAKLSAARIRVLSTGDYMVSKLEEKAAQQFEDLGIRFVWQYPINTQYVFDFYLPDSRTLVEIHGSYWHADPRIYSLDKLSITQKLNVERDRKKMALAARLGYKVRIIWEADFEKD